MGESGSNVEPELVSRIVECYVNILAYVGPGGSHRRISGTQACCHVLESGLGGYEFKREGACYVEVTRGNYRVSCDGTLKDRPEECELEMAEKRRGSTVRPR